MDVARPDDKPTVSPLRAGLTALRRFWRPFLLIQGAAVALAFAYHFSDPVRAACIVLAGWKASGGLLFAAGAGAVSGGLLPEVAKWVARHPRDRQVSRLGDVVFHTAFFAFAGVVIDGLYRGEARLFGDDARTATVVTKVAFDQFVFTPPWQAVIVALFLFRQRGYSWAKMRPALRSGFLSTRVLPLLLPCWCFWIPIVSVVYALPGPLQFLMFAFALGAWSLIMVFIAGDPEPAPA